MSHPAVAGIAADARLLALAQRELGSGAVPYRATLFDKCGVANWLIAWHQNTALPLQARFGKPDWGPWSRKSGIEYAHAPAWALSRILALRAHLDASTSDNEPLRVFPETHTLGVLSDEEVFSYAAAHDPVECLVDRGGVLAIRPRIIHSSSKAEYGKPRRVRHIEYADALDLAPGTRLAIALTIAAELHPVPSTRRTYERVVRANTRLDEIVTWLQLGVHR